VCVGEADSENDGSFLMLPVVMAYRNLMGNGKPNKRRSTCPDVVMFLLAKQTTNDTAHSD